MPNAHENVNILTVNVNNEDDMDTVENLLEGDPENSGNLELLRQEAQKPEDIT